MILVTDGNFTCVAIDEQGKPQVIPQANATVRAFSSFQVREAGDRLIAA